MDKEQAIEIIDKVVNNPKLVMSRVDFSLIDQAMAKIKTLVDQEEQKTDKGK